MSNLVKLFRDNSKDVEIDDLWAAADEIERLRAVVDAARDDMEGAKANCGKYPEAAGYKDCSAWIERGLRCSDCPVKVWLASTSESLAALEDSDDGL